MRLYRSARWLLLAMLLPLFPAMQAHAGIFISVGFAPPVLPVYVQPMCPEPNLMWVPGYWAYGPDGYYWVPGAWVPAPYQGALWTPPYWGYESGLYVFHPGYWGWNVGYYGGVNYGYGYYGRGFVGGRWHDRDFEYNRAVMHVNDRVIRTTYIDRTVIRDHEIVRDSRISYNGGPGGIRYQASPQERMAMREQHVPPTRAQNERVIRAQSNRAAYFSANHGRPQQTAMERPLARERVAPPQQRGPQRFRQQPGMQNQRQQPQRPAPQYQRPEQQRPQYQNQRPAPQYQRPEPQRQQPQYQRPEPQRPQYQNQRPEQQRPQPQFQRPEQQRPQYQNPRPQQQRPEARPAPQNRGEQRPHPEGRPREERRPQR